MLRLQCKNILKDNNLAITKNRLNVLHLFLSSKTALSLKSINISLKKIDRVTIFRVLNVFERNKIIHKIQLQKGKIFYALCEKECSDNNNHNHNHIHFLCEDCDNLFCLPISNFPKFNFPDHKLKNIDINISGLCSSCNV